jgi:cytochrome b pre-mRNA-processing protein 3
MSLFPLFRRRQKAGAADALYRAVVAQARQPRFYSSAAVPDTPDGRFDLIVAHAVLVLRRLHREPETTRHLAQALFDLMFADMDQNLREMGVGDLAVGKRIKAMAKGFYGRLAAYDRALEESDLPALQAALRRNLYRHSDPPAEAVLTVATYLQREAAHLDAMPLDRLMAGDLQFGTPPNRQPVTADG